MDRSGSPSTLALGSLLGCGILAIAFMASSASTMGCETVETKSATDAALPPCNRGPFTFFCDAPAPDAPTCNTDSNPSPVLDRLPQNTAYPVGCVVNFVGPRDEQGDCRLEAVCKCVEGPPVLVEPSPVEDDGGVDAGTRMPPSGAVWLCDP